MHKLTTDRVASLLAFARRILDSWPEGDIAGGDLRDIGVETGLFVPILATRPCGEACRCADYGDFPTTCYRVAPWVSEEKDGGNGT